MIRSAQGRPQRRLLPLTGLAALAAACFALPPLAAPPVALAVAGAPRAPQSPSVIVSQVATYPRDGADRVPADATVYFVFDQPTLKNGSFSVCDLDTTIGNQCVTLTERWSALGDTIFLTPIQPMAFGHRFGMRVGTIQATDGTYTSDLPIVYFTIGPRASLRIIGGADGRSLALTPGVPTPISLSVQETAGTAVEFISARIEIFADPARPPPAPFVAVPLRSETQPVSIRVGRFGVATLAASVTLPPEIARVLPGGLLGIRVTFEGTDETELPFAVASFSPAAATPAIASGLVLDSAILEWPLHGTAIAAGDTIRPRAVVTGAGTGSFRAAFYVDGELIAIEDGYMESGRPVTVTMRGPLPTRRLGEHRLSFSVEAPQSLDARPISFLCTVPPHGLAPPRRLPSRTEPGGGDTPPPAAPTRLAFRGTWLADGSSRYRAQRGSVVGWTAWRASYDLGPGRTLEAETSWRVRIDSTANGSGEPQHVRVRYASTRASLEWGDGAPALSADAPLFASAVPRRGAQARLTGLPVGDLEAYVTLDSHPASAGGPAGAIDSDLYAARLRRSLAGEAVRIAIYGGYTHEEPTPGAIETSVRTRAVYGGSGQLRLPHAWSFLGDAATVRHRAIAGVEAGRSRTGWRAELAGNPAGIAAKLEAFALQPDLATALNPYAISDRRGGQVGLSRRILNWNLFGAYRTESPAERQGLVPTVRVDRLRIGAAIALNPSSHVSSALVRVTHRGANTRFTENRLATEADLIQHLGGRTTARFDATVFDDERGVRVRRRNFSGSVVSTSVHPRRITSTVAAGLEQDRDHDSGLTNRTAQASAELRWEALPGRLLVTPFFAFASRDHEQLGSHVSRLSVRLQISLLRVPRLGENALSVEGRVDRIEQKKPIEGTDTEGAVQLSLGHRFEIGPAR